MTWRKATNDCERKKMKKIVIHFDVNFFFFFFFFFWNITLRHHHHVPTKKNPTHTKKEKTKKISSTIGFFVYIHIIFHSSYVAGSNLMLSHVFLNGRSTILLQVILHFMCVYIYIQMSFNTIKKLSIKKKAMNRAVEVLVIFFFLFFLCPMMMMTTMI